MGKHPILCEALAALMDKSTQVINVYTALDAPAALTLVKENSVDIALIDTHLSGMNEVSFLHTLRTENPSIKFIGIASLDECERLAVLLQGKAEGILLKPTTTLKEIDHCIAEVMAGQVYFSEPIRRLLPAMNFYLKEPFSGFSHRELDVLRLVCEGQVTKEIAQILNLKRTSVEDYRKSMLKKSHSKNTAQLVAFALRNGFL